MKQFLEFLPVLIFVIVYYLTDIYTATGALMAAVTVQLILTRWRAGAVPTQLTVTFWVVLIFGGMTLFFHDKLFIQWKPTILNWLMAGALLYSHYFTRRNFIQRMLGSQLELPSQVWARLNFGWATGFIAAGIANLYVAYNYSESFWVSYKLIGGTAITLSYLGITVTYLALGGYLKVADKDNAMDVRKVEKS